MRSKGGECPVVPDDYQSVDTPEGQNRATRGNEYRGLEGF